MISKRLNSNKGSINKKKAVAIILAVLTLVCSGCASDHVVTDSSAMQELVKEEVVQENDSSLDESIFAEESVTQSESIKELETMPVMTPQESNFEVHYIDVGQADATLVVCDEEYIHSLTVAPHKENLRKISSLMVPIRL